MVHRNAPPPTGTATFYDAFATRLISDFVHGNPRTEAAISHALRWIPRQARSVLDIGCGIGWSSWEIKRHHPGLSVVGVDLSNRMIDLATTLFAATGLSFRVMDFVADSLCPPQRFDVVTMLDTYEHIPHHQRDSLHRRLAEVLAAESRLILTFPSVSHQQRLRDSHPSGLQPVDEDVAPADIGMLAEDLGAHVLLLEHTSIWNANDYVHAVLERGPGMDVPIGARRARPSHLATKLERANRVRFGLRARVTRDGAVLQDHGPFTACVVAPQLPAYSESFIRAHMEHLGTHTRCVVGQPVPLLVDEGYELISKRWAARGARKLLTGLLQMPQGYFEERAFYRFLLSAGVNVVLAEYGPTAVAVFDACNRAGIPLIAHFHGYDAFDRRTLSEYEGRYATVLSQVHAVIAVSREMAHQLIELGAPSHRVHTIPCGVDVSAFVGSEPASASPRFIAVGRFVDKKAPHLTLLAFREVLEHIPEATLTMAGEGPLLEACRTLISALRVSHAVTLLGAVPHAQVATAMRSARAFVQHSIKTSYGDCEGTPVAILEAQASGLPVVATRHAGIKDVVLDGQTGFLVEEGDVAAMATAMRRLASDAALSQKMGQAARARVLANFTMEKNVALLAELLRAAALNTSGAPKRGLA